MEALNQVRAAVIANRPIETENDDVVIYTINMDTGEKVEAHRYPRNLKTAFHSKNSGKSYDLLAIVTCVKYAALSFSDYVAKTRAEKVLMISTIDKKELMAYLRGDIEESAQVFEPSSAPKRKSEETSSKEPPSAAKKLKDTKDEVIKEDSGETDTEMETKKRILDREYTHRDRTTMMNTSKSFEGALTMFEMILKEEKDRSAGSGQPSLLSQQSTKSIPLHVALKRAIPDIPIIIVPAGYSDLITLLNAKDFLEEGHFVTTEQKKAEGNRKQTSVTIRVKENDHEYTFKIVDNVIRFTDRDWKCVVGVIVSGQTWQFKDWHWKFPLEIFKRTCGIHIYSHGTPLLEEIKKWDVKILMIHPHKRHLDKVASSEFWRHLFAHLRLRVNN